LQQKFNSTSSVNVDTEMSNLIQLQNAYAANAHIMSAVQSMMPPYSRPKRKALKHVDQQH
jgi:flagellar hook-associated protein FlgK